MTTLSRARGRTFANAVGFGIADRPFGHHPEKAPQVEKWHKRSKDRGILPPKGPSIFELARQVRNDLKGMSKAEAVLTMLGLTREQVKQIAGGGK